jgi:hypothetical protein
MKGEQIFTSPFLSRCKYWGPLRGKKGISGNQREIKIYSPETVNKSPESGDHPARSDIIVHGCNGTGSR